MKFFQIKSLDKLSSIIFRTQVAKKTANASIVSNLVQFAGEDINSIFGKFSSGDTGLNIKQVHQALEKYGYNQIIGEKRKPLLIRFFLTFYNPLILLLFLLVIVSFFTGDMPTALIIIIMILVSVSLRFFQEDQAYNSAKKLRSMVKTTCTVIRNGKVYEIDLRQVVPGDIIRLAAGDLIPADLRIIRSKDLFINQSLLTGESLSVEKHSSLTKEKVINVFEAENICYMGTNVESGTAEAIVLTTGSSTYFGSLAKDIVGQRAPTSFDKGIERFTWLMIIFMAVMVPLVFLINGFGKGNWWEAFLFAISVAVGLTPEMLPAIVTVNLSKGALAMAEKKVIVKRLSSMQNFGAMNILCADKTGTLTENKIVLVENLNINGDISPEVLRFAYLNSIYQTGFKNVLDEAVLNHAKTKNILALEKTYNKIDELPFDFSRRRMSVIVEDNTQRFLITKGAVEEVTRICRHYEMDNKSYILESGSIKRINLLNEKLSKDGFRVIAVAYKKLHDKRLHYGKADEDDMIFLGFMTFLDPPKESAAAALSKLMHYGISVKVLTGDNELVTRKVCQGVGLKIEGVLLGTEIDRMDDDALKKVVQKTTIFSKLSPGNKKRVVESLRQGDNVVGFLGDGINDAPALRAADVGISVNLAVDIAKESADMILLEMSLMVLSEGVVEGRKVFGNIIKYIRMGASSNFGNVFSVMGASLLLPFLPMKPLQLLVNNLLYDLSQTAIPTDNVDEEYITKPRKWKISDIRRFMFYIGPISSIFDYVTFGVMIFIFHVWIHQVSVFQTSWFVESILTQTLIVHVIRSKKLPFFQTLASKPLLLATSLIMIIGIYLPFSPIASYLGFVRPPVLFWPILVVILLSYIGLTQLVKMWYTNKFGYD